MLKFKEVQTKELNSDGTDFWVGVGIGFSGVGAAAGLAAVLT
ncbi:TPA: hypothetical protein ACN4SP_002723 [Staphylococcus aureus]|nr:hypothetical protein [Staphylococcus aureus]MDQ7900157.1 hypothetical protein [Staphylococcus aureus]WJB27129.1 hypothetical protein PCL65_14205 [Staphylococcus aureus]GBZ04610.1 hypothetical protein M6K109_2631 [Staphylococcus aureus]